MEAEPLDVFHDGVDVLRLFLGGICVVKAKVSFAAEFVGEAKVEADGLGVSNVQIAVWLGREARLHAAGILVGLQVVLNDVANEVRRLGRGFRRGHGHCLCGSRGSHSVKIRW